MCLKSPDNSSLEETGTQTHFSLTATLLLISRGQRHSRQRRDAIGNLVYFYIWKLESATVYKQFAKRIFVAEASSVSLCKHRDEG